MGSSQRRGGAEEGVSGAAQGRHRGGTRSSDHVAKRSTATAARLSKHPPTDPVYENPRKGICFCKREFSSTKSPVLPHSPREKCLHNSGRARPVNSGPMLAPHEREDLFT